jgi:hypothetical protein
MDEELIGRLIGIVNTIVNDDSMPYRDKKAQILAACDEDDSVALAEFASWFETTESED